MHLDLWLELVLVLYRQTCMLLYCLVWNCPDVYGSIDRKHRIIHRDHDALQWILPPLFLFEFVWLWLVVVDLRLGLCTAAIENSKWIYICCKCLVSLWIKNWCLVGDEWKREVQIFVGFFSFCCCGSCVSLLLFYCSTILLEGSTVWEWRKLEWSDWKVMGMNVWMSMCSYHQALLHDPLCWEAQRRLVFLVGFPHV